MTTSFDQSRANRIILCIKSEGGSVAIFDVLQTLHIPLYWWRTHRKWFFHTFPYVTSIEKNDLLYLEIDTIKITTEE